MARYGYNWFQPQSPRQLKRRVNRDLQGRLGSGNRAIDAYTNALASHLQPAEGRTHSNYLAAEQQQAAVDQALANRLSGSGQALQQDLASQLGAAGQDQAPAGTVGQIGAGASNAGYASGSANLSQLLSQGAAAQQFAGMLPNLARLQGQQQRGQYRSQLYSELPKLMQDAQDREFQKAVASQSGLVSMQKVAESAAYHKATLSVRQQAIRAENRRTGMNLAERARHNQIGERQQAQRDIERARHARIAEKQSRRRQWYREHQKKKDKSSAGGAPWSK
jgi:hypothetical protein